MALQILWFALWGILWAVYFTLDGFDFGCGMLRSFLAKDESERRVVLRAIGPLWNGNEVWLITAGGATFAAFPIAYASMFSFLYLPMLIILFSLILRGIAVEYREKHDGPRWNRVWDRVFAGSSFVAPLVLGLGFGNIFQGLPIAQDGYRGSFLGLFNPFGLLTAALFVALFLEHGALWLAFKSTGALHERSAKFASAMWWILLAVAALFLAAAPFATRLAENYVARPALAIVPLLAVAALVAAKAGQGRARWLGAFLCSAAAIFLVVAAALVGLFPSLIPSSLDPAAGLTIYNASSSQYTLGIMAIVAAIFVPLVIAYQFLAYRFFSGKVTSSEVADGEGGY